MLGRVLACLLSLRKPLSRRGLAWFGPGVLAWLIRLVPTASRAAGFTWNENEQDHRQWVDASSTETIPVGTKITVANWQQYKRFLPVGIQAALSGDYTFHAGSGPEYTMVVGPTTHFSMPADGWKTGKNMAARSNWSRPDSVVS